MKKRMALLDSGFLRMERHESPQHGTILVIFKMPDDAPPDYMQQLATRMREFPVTRERFNWRLSTSLLDAALPAWEMLAPEQIELDYHFRHSALPQPGGELELALVVSRLATHPVDLHRPPWEVHLIEGLENGRFALFVKMHHSLIDGVSTVKMIRSWLSDDPAQTGTPPLWATANAGQPDATRPSETRRPEGSVLGSMLAIGKSIRSISGAAGKTIAAAVSDDSSLVAPYHPPRTIFNGAITQRRRISTQRVEFSRIKSIAGHIDGTVNDAIATILGTAIRRYLTELDSLPDRALVAGVLASLRGTVDARTSAETGNIISFIFADLATDTDDFTERAARVVRSTRAGKDHLLGLAKDAMSYSTLMLAPFVLTTVSGTGHLLPAFNVGLSNVPGIGVPTYWNGAYAEALHATTIITNGQALVVTVTNWHDHLCFTFTACPDTIPHPQRLSVYLMDALGEAEKALAPS